MSDGVARTSEGSYRQRWTWDGVGWGTHCVDCYPGNCPYRVYTRDGRVWREEPSGDFGTVEPGVPDMNPAGCNKGAVWSRQLDNPDRLRHPMRRVGERGSGEWERISWDDALTMLADSIIETIEEHGPECVMHEGSPEQTTVVPTHRFFNQLGGTITDFNATTNDFNVGLQVTFGKYGIVSSVDDWFHSELMLVWFMNPAYTRIPHFHYITEARYHGTEVVLLAPDYNASAMHADTFVSVEPGSDAALALSMGQVILEEGIADLDFVAAQTDLALLVRADTQRFLRESDVVAGGRDDQFFHWIDGAAVPADRGSLRHGPQRPALEGRFSVQLADGTTTEAVPALQVLRDQLDAQYRPEKASEACGVHPDVIRRLARATAAKRTNILLGAAPSKYYHGDLIERSLCLLLALTGNWGKKGSGVRAWSAGMFDGPAISMAKGRPGVEGAEDVINGLDMLIGMAQADDPTMTREIAATSLARVQSNMVPPFFFWYHHAGYRERWNNPEWGDPTMRRTFDEYVDEALASGWWDGLCAQPPEKPPRVLIECGGNMLRRTRGGRRTILENVWPKLDLIAVIDWRMSITALHADLLLPAANCYEKLDFHIPTPHVMQLVFSDRVQDPEGEAMSEWEIFAALARRLGERAAERGLTGYVGRDGMPRSYADLWDSYTLDGYFADSESLADEMVRDSVLAGTLAEGTDLGTVREKGHLPFASWGILPFAMAQASPFPEGETHVPLRNHVEGFEPYPTLTRRAQFYIDHPWFIEAGEAFPVHKDAPSMGGDHPLKFTSGHNRWSVHSMNIAHTDLLQTHRGEPHVVLNPRDASARGIVDNAPVELFNDVGSCVLPAKLSASVRPGQAIVYNGWEPFQFTGWVGTNDVEPGMVKWLHLAGGYGHLTYAPTGWQPATVDRATRLDARKA